MTVKQDILNLYDNALQCLIMDEVNVTWFSALRSTLRYGEETWRHVPQAFAYNKLCLVHVEETEQWTHDDEIRHSGLFDSRLVARF